MAPEPAAPRWAEPGTGAGTGAEPALEGTGEVRLEDTAGIAAAGRPAAAPAWGPAGIRAAARIEGIPAEEHIGAPAAEGKLGAGVVAQD